MELRQLEYFVAVAEEASFTKAAARVHVAQPGVSAQIRQLERELGQDLFDRTGRTVRLTAVGAAVLPYARAALEAVAAARLAVEELTGLLRGRVAVGMLTACSIVSLFDLLESFSQRYPAVEITLSEANSDHLIAALQDGHLDMALVGLAGTPPPGIETEVLADEALVAAVSPSDPLAASATITLQALQEQPLISLPQGTGLRAALDDACAATGLHPRIALEASSPGVLAQLAARGLGVAILPESTAHAHPNLHTLAITHPSPRSRVEFAWRAEGPISPAARALIHHTRTLLAGASADALPAALSLPLPRRQRAGSS
ncbi:MAG: LysR family transcriptional regulator [Ktedonobacterales bacterium]